MVFQRPNPLPISVYENVVFGLRIHDDKPPSQERTRRRRRKSADRSRPVGRPQGPARRQGHHPPARSSSKSSASPACSRSSREIILMDEPCSALDVEGTRAIEELMLEPRRPLHHRHRHAQHGPGPPRQRRVHLHAHGRTHRAQPHRRPLPQSEEPEDRGIHRRPLRLISSRWQCAGR